MRPRNDLFGMMKVKTTKGDFAVPYTRVLYYKIKCPFCPLYITSKNYAKHIEKRHGAQVLD